MKPHAVELLRREQVMHIPVGFLGESLHIALACILLFLCVKIIQWHQRFFELYIDDSRKGKKKLAKISAIASQKEMTIWEGICRVFTFILHLCSWLLVEGLILYLKLMLFVVIILLAKSLAEDVRDWWHKPPNC